jgi:hypothetical protein
MKEFALEASTMARKVQDRVRPLTLGPCHETVSGFQQRVVKKQHLQVETGINQHEF